jgi:hypothetical protein
MINITYVRTALQELFSTIVGGSVPVIFAEQSNAPRPTQRPYITLKILGPKQIGYAEMDGPNGSGIAGIRAQYTIRALLQGFGDGAIEQLNKIDFSFNKPSIVDLAIEKSFAYHKSNGVRDITQFLDTKWEQRATLEIEFYISDEDTDDVGFIDSINNLSGEIDGNSGDEVAISPIIFDVN